MMAFETVSEVTRLWIKSREFSVRLLAVYQRIGEYLSIEYFVEFCRVPVEFLQRVPGRVRARFSQRVLHANASESLSESLALLGVTACHIHLAGPLCLMPDTGGMPLPFGIPTVTASWSLPSRRSIDTDQGQVSGVLEPLLVPAVSPSLTELSVDQ